MAVRIESLSPVLGASVEGVDLAGPVDDAEIAALREALADRLVLCVRDQDLAPAAFAGVARRFGAPKPYFVARDRVPEAPDVSVVTNRPDGPEGPPRAVAMHWHTDDSYLAAPATLTMLHAKTLPATGGDTEFIDCYAVLAALPADLRRRIEGLSAVHKYLSRRVVSAQKVRTAAEEAASPEVVHPLVRRHPWTGRLALYVNPNRIDRIAGWGAAESDALLDELYAFAFRPEFQYRHRWRAGDLVVWDNRCAMHRANADYDVTQLRVMHRVMLEGEVPLGAGDAA